ncbi:MAG TPA: O-antigen ligase family protein [Candidatus Dormibacteraeota bacterium]|nr:O-antigen ligase family protein [Candidatus Dormibacteraeota bacterium]
MTGVLPRDPPRSVVWVLCAGLACIPVLRPSLPGNSSPVDLLIGLGIAMTLAWAMSSDVRVHVPYVFPVGILLAAGAIGGLAGPAKGLSMLQLVQDVALLAWCASLVNVARSPAALQLLVRTWAWSSIAWAGLLIVAYVTGVDTLSGVTDRTGGRASLTFGDANLAGTYFVLSVLIVAASRTPRHRAARLGGYALLLAAVALTGSNGALLALAIAIPVAGVLSIHRRLGAVPAVAAIAACVVAAAVVVPRLDLGALQDQAQASDQQLLVDSIGRTDQSTYDREALVDEAQDLYYSDLGLTGWGPRATKTALTMLQVPFPKEAHDDYVAALVERGILGAIGLIALIAAVAFRTRTLLRRGQAALVGAVVAVAVFSTNEQVLHFRQVWALFAIVAAYHLWAP